MGLSQGIQAARAWSIYSLGAAIDRVNSFRGQQVPKLRTLLFHKFIFDGESVASAKSRLRKQLDWLVSNYTPVRLSQLTSLMERKSFGKGFVHITCDDAKTDLMHMHSVFAEYNIPLSVFVCAGWSSQSSAPTRDSALARLVADIEWYSGPKLEIKLGSHALSLTLGSSDKAGEIDGLLRDWALWLPHLEELQGILDLNRASGGYNSVCSWEELVELSRNPLVEFGSHSVTHVNLANASKSRSYFEMKESRRLIEKALGPCTAWAYPFGSAHTHNAFTREALIEAGYDLAFLTSAGLADSDSDLLSLPRLYMPEKIMMFPEFVGRTRGATMAFPKNQ